MRQLRRHNVEQREYLAATVWPKSQEMVAVIQYILTSAQSFGSQDYYNKSLMTILGLAGPGCRCTILQNEQTWTKWIIVCSNENTYLGA